MKCTLSRVFERAGEGPVANVHVPLPFLPPSPFYLVFSFGGGRAPMLPHGYATRSKGEEFVIGMRKLWDGSVLTGI